MRIRGAGTGRDLGVLLGGAGVSALGSSVSLLAVLLALRPLGAGWVAAAFGAELVPMVLAAPVAGQLVDRVRNRELLAAALAVQGGGDRGGRLVGADPGTGDGAAGRPAVVGVGGAFANPAVCALLPRIAGEEGSTRAYGWYAAVSQGGVLAGFSLAGVLVQAFGIRTALLVDAASYAVMAAGVTRLRAQRHLAAELATGVPAVPDAAPSGTANPRTSGCSGFGLLARDRLLRIAVTGLAAAILASIVVNVTDVFFILGDLGASPATYGLVTAVWPLAGVVGGWAAGGLRTDHALLTALAAAAAVMGAGLLLTGWLVTLWSLVLAWLLGGAANAVQRVAMNALVRSRTPDGERGRAFAAVGALLQAANVAGIALGAAVVALLGARGSLLAAGAVTVAVGVLTWLLAPRS